MHCDKIDISSLNMKMALKYFIVRIKSSRDVFRTPITHNITQKGGFRKFLTSHIRYDGSIVSLNTIGASGGKSNLTSKTGGKESISMDGSPRTKKLLVTYF